MIERGIVSLVAIGCLVGCGEGNESLTCADLRDHDARQEMARELAEKRSSLLRNADERKIYLDRISAECDSGADPEHKPYDKVYLPPFPE